MPAISPRVGLTLPKSVSELGPELNGRRKIAARITMPITIPRILPGCTVSVQAWTDSFI